MTDGEGAHRRNHGEERRRSALRRQGLAETRAWLRMWKALIDGRTLSGEV